MDYGPIIVTLYGAGIGCRLHPDDPECSKTNSHVVLLIGWVTENNIFKWRIKDSWPSKPGENPRHGIYNDSLNVFNYQHTFYRVYPVHPLYEIKFTLHHNGKVEYKRNFTITGPREDLVSISVLDSYGGSPPEYGDIYYICPNTIYHIYYNNYDSNCSTWDYDWGLPYGWTEYWRYGNMISVNTNDYPYGMLEVWGKTCCENQSRIKLKTQYFYEYYECGEYFMVFPNPANNYIDIDINREKMEEENIRTDAKCTLTLYDKTGLVKYKTEFRDFPFRIDTGNLPEGVYLMNLLYNGKTYSMSVVIKY